MQREGVGWVGFRDPSVGLRGEVSLAEGLLYKKERLEALLAKDFSLGLISFFAVRLIGADRLLVLTVCCCLREVSVCFGQQLRLSPCPGALLGEGQLLLLLNFVS